LTFALTLVVLVLASWIGFLSPMRTRDASVTTLAFGAIVPALLLYGWRSRISGAVLLPVILFVPAMFLSDLLAHNLFNGCVLY
jgi:hypothetical protein